MLLLQMLPNGDNPGWDKEGRGLGSLGSLDYKNEESLLNFRQFLKDPLLHTNPKPQVYSVQFVPLLITHKCIKEELQ